jgi:hypothetical protein
MRRAAAAAVEGCFLVLTSAAVAARGSGDSGVVTGGGPGGSPFAKRKVRTNGILTVRRQVAITTAVVEVPPTP